MEDSFVVINTILKLCIFTPLYIKFVSHPFSIKFSCHTLKESIKI